MSNMFAKLALPVMVAGALGAVNAPVMALEEGDWLVRGRIINISPDDKSSNATSNGTPVPGTDVSVDSAFTLDLDITYMITSNFGVELLLDIPTKHNVSSSGATLRSLAPGEILSARVLPPSLLLQYHFIPHGQIRPYVGFGVNYTLFFDEESTASLNTGLGGVKDLDLDPSVGWAAQAGVDFDMGNDWFLNADIKYIDINTTASFKSGALGNVEVDVDINPWVFGLGVGRRF